MSGQAKFPGALGFVVLVLSAASGWAAAQGDTVSESGAPAFASSPSESDQLASSPAVIVPPRNAPRRMRPALLPPLPSAQAPNMPPTLPLGDMPGEGPAILQHVSLCCAPFLPYAINNLLKLLRSACIFARS